MLLLVVLLLALAIPASATQYNPPWAHNYGFVDPDLDTRPQATYAASMQSIVGYNSYDLPNSGAYIGFNTLKDDAVFYVNNHGLEIDGYGGGGIHFYNGTYSLLIAQPIGWLPPLDKYYISDFTTQVKDVFLIVYVACYSGKTSPYAGYLVDMSASKGVDNVIGFKKMIDDTASNYWSDRFWYRCLHGGQGGIHQPIKYAASGAIGDVIIEYGGFYGLESMYSKYRYQYDYLDPARYGVV